MDLSFREKYKEQVRTLADELRNEPMPLLTEELFALFETTGNRLKYEDVYFGRRKLLAVYGMAALIYRRREDVEKLEQILWDICDEECWALPAHVDRKDADWRHTVDLFASETAHTLMEIISLMAEMRPEENGLTMGEVKSAGEELSEAVCARVREEVEKRVLTPVFSTEPNYKVWECSDHNWNAVCAGSIGCVCIYLMQGKEEERLQKCLQRICHSLTFYLEGFEEDGACMEGVGYFTYGMTYYVGFAELLYRHSGGSWDLFKNKKLEKIARFQQKMYFGSGRTISFSDGDQEAKFRMGLTCFLANKYEGVVVPNEALAAEFTYDHCYRFMGLCRDYLWTGDHVLVCNPTAEKQHSEYAVAIEDVSVDLNDTKGMISRHDVLPSAQWSICESKNGVGFAAKGGDNGEPHNHNDIGSFLYLRGEDFLLTDLGAGEYTKDYFREGRYEILCNSSMGHSVPVIGGMLQAAGKEYRAGNFVADGAGKTVIEFAGAYPQGAIRLLERTLDFSLEDGSLKVTDNFELPEETTSFTEQLVTQEQVTLEENAVTIAGNKYACRIQLPKEIQNLRVVEKPHSNHQGGAEIVRLIQWDVPVASVNVSENGVVDVAMQSTWFGISPE